MRRFLVGFLATIGVLSILLTMVGTAGVWWWVDTFDTPEPLPDHIVLSIDLSGSVDEASPLDPLAELFPEQAGLGLVDLVDILDQATGDRRVTGAIFDLSGAQIGLAQTQELRAAVFRFRAAGKTIVAFADSYEGDGVGPYYLASAFDRIWMQPSGLLVLTGISMEVPLARNLLDEVGLLPEFEQRFEFKGAMATLTETTMPAAVRDNLARVANSLYGQVVSGIASTRRLGGTTVSALIDRGPLLAGEARGNGLVDALGYRSDAEASIGLTIDNHVTGARYLAQAGRPNADGTRVALIHLDGTIDRGEGGGLSGRGSVGSAQITETVDEVLADKAVRAVILRISSPGGSYVASDTMRHDIGRLRAAGLPVIASFANIAASGGYFAALPADHIIAHPATLTGSIGAVGGKVSGSGLLDKLEVAIDRVEVGRNAGMFSSTRPFTSDQRQHLRRMLDDIYADFAGKVGEARRLSPGEIDAVARGRIWTGEDAQRVGLVDGLGGYAEAMQLTRQTIGLTPDAPIERIRFPRGVGSLDALFEVIRSGEIRGVLTKMQDITRYMDAVLRFVPTHGSGLIHTEAPRFYPAR
ncbi:dihydropyrimidinase [alpha proteobacterium BAL199]|jgi:protease IV|nr:dihydropyrimidinase [alpha proteobacterium BAL199]